MQNESITMQNEPVDTQLARIVELNPRGFGFCETIDESGGVDKKAFMMLATQRPVDHWGDVPVVETYARDYRTPVRVNDYIYAKVEQMKKDANTPKHHADFKVLYWITEKDWTAAKEIINARPVYRLVRRAGRVKMSRLQSNPQIYVLWEGKNIKEAIRECSGINLFCEQFSGVYFEFLNERGYWEETPFDLRTGQDDPMLCNTLIYSYQGK